MKKIIKDNKKIIFGVIIGLILGSVSVYAGAKLYAGDVSVSAPTGSNLGNDATLQDSLDELYSIADKYDELKTEINSLKESLNKNVTNLTNMINGKTTTQTFWKYFPETSIATGTKQVICSVSLTKGSYMLYFKQSFNSNKTGYRQLLVQTSDTSWGTTVKDGANQSGSMTLNVSVPLIIDTTKTINFIAYQNSGSTLTGDTICQVVKLP